jgi:hypothetical protein
MRQRFPYVALASTSLYGLLSQTEASEVGPEVMGNSNMTDHFSGNAVRYGHLIGCQPLTTRLLGSDSRFSFSGKVGAKRS